jgi:hypothetical protein
MAKVQVDFGVFQDALGHPLALGYLTFRLNTDAVTSGNQQVVAGRIVRVDLDVNGLINGAALFWPNTDLTPIDTVYIVKAYKANGQLVWENRSAALTTDTNLLLQETSFDFVLEDGSGVIVLEPVIN